MITEAETTGLISVLKAMSGKLSEHGLGIAYALKDYEEINQIRIYRKTNGEKKTIAIFNRGQLDELQITT